MLLPTFWDGNRWIDLRGTRPDRRATDRRNRLADWIATGLILLILGAVVLPLGPAQAETVRVTLSPDTGSAGMRVTAQVTGARPDTALALRWDGIALKVPVRVADSQGAASFRFTVPTGSVGQHDVSVVSASRGKPRGLRVFLAPGVLLASATFSVVSPNDVAPDPTPAPATVAPTPNATPSPTPRPATSTPVPATPAATPATTPVPPPPPTSAPTPPPATPPPAPGCTQSFSGDKTGSTDVTGALQSFLMNAPAGATVCLATNGQYRVDGTVHLARRESALTIEGSGARLFATSRRNQSILLVDQGGHNIVVRNLTLEGHNPSGRTANTYSAAYQEGHGIQIGGVVGMTIANVRILNVNGDGIYISGGYAPGYRWADSISIQGVLIDGTGRNGVSFTDGARNVTVSGSTVRYTGLYAFDIEPNGLVLGGVAAGVDGITITGNAISRYTISSQWGPYLFAASGYGPENDIEFSNNTVTGQMLKITIQPNGTPRTNIRILNNRSDTRVGGPTMSFSGCSNLTVTGNVQPLSGGTLASVSGCTNVNISNNNTN